MPSIRKIASIGHPVLRKVAKNLTLEEIQSPTIQQFIDDLIATMRDANGAGLAATQVFEEIAVCAIEVGANNPRYPYKPAIPLTILINPKLTPIGTKTFNNFEGCLSVPNLRGQVKRFTELRVEALDRYGQPLDFIVKGLSAGTYQHEVDHLQGKLFVDRVTDPTSLCTWEHFEKYHRARFVQEVTALVAEYGA